MKKLLTYILFAVIAMTVHAQMYHAKVIDSDTGEALPYAHIASSQGSVTVSNVLGEFEMVAKPESKLQITYVRYESMSIHSCQRPEEYRKDEAAQHLATRSKCVLQFVHTL